LVIAGSAMRDRGTFKAHSSRTFIFMQVFIRAEFYTGKRVVSTRHSPETPALPRGTAVLHRSGAHHDAYCELIKGMINSDFPCQIFVCEQSDSAVTVSAGNDWPPCSVEKPPLNL
jgi:hypothetical protein